MRYKSTKANIQEQKDKRKYLRNHATPAEAILWRALKKRGADGFKFRRQQGIGPYILDFYCPELQLSVELDGSSHDYKREYDMQRTKFLYEQGIHEMRFLNEQVIYDAESVLKEIIRIGKEIKNKRE